MAFIKLKKKKAEEVSTSAFKGDLAFTKKEEEAPAAPKEDSEKNVQITNKRGGPDKNSDDAVVYLDIEKLPRTKWTCKECGTINDENYRGCVVCGLKR